MTRDLARRNRQRALFYGPFQRSNPGNAHTAGPVRGESPLLVGRDAIMTGNIWDQVLSRVETKVNRHSFYTWFKPTSYVSDRDGGLRVRVPNALFRDWLTKHYAAVIAEALAEVQRPGS